MFVPIIFIIGKGRKDMEKDMAVYLNELTSCNMDTLDVILSHQYRKFQRLYWLLKEYSENISKMKYKSEDPSSLEITVIFLQGTNIKSIKKDLEKAMRESSYIESVETVGKKNLRLSITYDEG